MTTQRKILTLIIIVFILIIGGLFFLYQSFVQTDTEPTGNGTGGTGSGGSILFPNTGQGETSGIGTTTGPSSIATLRQISSVPVSGAVIFTDEETAVIRYVERSSGHIFETTSTSLELNRISNTTIPRIQRSFWAPDGSTVILQYLDENETLKSFYGKVAPETGALEGWFLGNNISDVAVAPDGDMLYVQKIGGGVQGIISNFDGTNSATIFSSTQRDWRPLWMGKEVTFTTNPARDITGFMYQIQKGEYKKILSRDGLITNINPDGGNILFSLSNSRETNLFVYNQKTKETVEVPFRTLAEKCAWSGNTVVFCASPHRVTEGIVPDDWYKGSLSFSDDIWSYNTETDEAQLVYDALSNEQIFDAINLRIDSEGKVLLFTDKNNLTLWALSLKERL
ncbi:MAG: hypothetical protein WD509_01240 [Candidatus Paceibacterota bacterium]